MGLMKIAGPSGHWIVQSFEDGKWEVIGWTMVEDRAFFFAREQSRAGRFVRIIAPSGQEFMSIQNHVAVFAN